MLISWKVAVSSGNDWYFFTTKPWRLNERHREKPYESTDYKDCLYASRIHAHIPFLCSITCLWSVPISTGGKRRGFNENLHHSLFAFLAWRIHIYPHCLQKTKKLLQRHDYSHTHTYTIHGRHHSLSNTKIKPKKMYNIQSQVTPTELKMHN